MLGGLFVGFLAKPQTPTITTQLLMEPNANFAQAPVPSYVMRQASSYSRTSKTPGNEAWFANDDYGKYLRQEGSEYVMADLKGPGAVVRIWSANPMGTLRFYFDGESEPRIKVGMRQWVESIQNNTPNGKFWAFWADRGWNVYFPFPYAKSLKITMQPGEKENPLGLYYHVGYRTYTADTSVQTFVPSDLDLSVILRQTIAAPFAKSVDLDPKKANTKISFNGSSTINRAVLVWNPKIKDFHKTLRSIWVTATFDGEKTVSAPLGDFFAMPFGSNRKNPEGKDVNPDLTLKMPFKKSAVFSFDRNVAAKGAPVKINFEGDYTSWDADTELNYFHCDFSRDRGRTRPMRDMHWLDARGEGYLVGCHLLVSNPVKGWWGEGDEKIYVDDEPFPSIFGTGTEDFLNYAWSSPVPFWTPAGSQDFTTTRSSNYGYCNISRWMTRDPIPFTSSIKLDVEMWHWNDCLATFDRTVYWYAKKGAITKGQAKPSWADLELPDFPESWRVKGAIEAEKLSFSKTGGTTEIQSGFADLSADGQIWWNDPAVGSKLNVQVPAANGTYELTINACHARDYGIHQLYWNGEKLGQPIDFYGTGVTWKQIKLGKVKVTGGKGVLTAECVGQNEKAEPRRMFGLDYLLMKKL